MRKTLIQPTGWDKAAVKSWFVFLENLTGIVIWTKAELHDSCRVLEQFALGLVVAGSAGTATCRPTELVHYYQAEVVDSDTTTWQANVTEDFHDGGGGSATLVPEPGGFFGGVAVVPAAFREGLEFGYQPAELDFLLADNRGHQLVGRLVD